MKFTATKENFTQHLSFINTIIERKTTTPILSHVLLEILDSETLNLKGTDGEITLSGKMQCEVHEPGSTTVSCNKLFDIVRTLEDNCLIECVLQDDQLLIQNNDSKFYLTTLPANDFPVSQEIDVEKKLIIQGALLADAIEKVKSSMAYQDVRHYLNGLHLDAREEKLHIVSTDGHRMSLNSLPYLAIEHNNEQQAKEIKSIIPRKSVNELQKLLLKCEKEAVLEISKRHLRLALPGYQMLTRLIDGDYPDYNTVLPPAKEQPIVIDRKNLLEAVQRGRALNSDKQAGIRVDVQEHNIKLFTRNIDNESAEDRIDILNPEGLSIQIGFNIGYLIDILQTTQAENIQLHIQDNASSCMITSQENPELIFVIMPMYL